ncbi:hypothetical protein B7P43_G09072 [Cryptotermes secundus]|uniref:Uncharacterized protein n=1 Tax=Cryptotermes secundus TaxID=105785 RepID=A0A2J7PLF9_9NEOP|nr:hypothetical protein B7P43_G09072 [Cryptotermes secundus]
MEGILCKQAKKKKQYCQTFVSRMTHCSADILQYVWFSRRPGPSLEKLLLEPRGTDGVASAPQASFGVICNPSIYSSSS